MTSGNTNPIADDLPADQFPWRSQLPHLPLLTFDPVATKVRVEFIDRFGAIAHARELY